MSLSNAPNKDKAKDAIIAALIQMFREAEADRVARRLQGYIAALKAGRD
jgi:hypothetical protein